MEVIFTTADGRIIHWDGMQWECIGDEYLTRQLNGIVLKKQYPGEGTLRAAKRNLEQLTGRVAMQPWDWTGMPLERKGENYFIETDGLAKSAYGWILRTNVPRTDQSNAGSALAEAELHLRRCSCPDGTQSEVSAWPSGQPKSEAGDEDAEDRWDLPEREWAALIGWAQNRDMILDVSGPEIEKTREHGITFLDDGYCRKYTRPDLAGFTVDWGEDGIPWMRNATPREYLLRLRLQNELFLDSIELLGLWRDSAGAWRIVTRQPLVAGHSPSYDALEIGMKALNFRQLRWRGIGYQAAQAWRIGRMAVWDIHPANVFRIGGVAAGLLVPVDVIITRLPDGFPACHFHPD